jgi:hypothetical protein
VTPDVFKLNNLMLEEQCCKKEETLGDHRHWIIYLSFVLGGQLFEVVLEFEADDLGDGLALVLVLEQVEIGDIPDVVLEGVKDDVQHSVGVQVEVPDESLHVLLHRLDVGGLDVDLVELYDQLGEPLVLFSEQVELLLLVLVSSPHYHDLLPEAVQVNEPALGQGLFVQLLNYDLGLDESLAVQVPDERDQVLVHDDLLAGVETLVELELDELSQYGLELCLG